MAPASLTRRRVVCFIAVCANCITAGSIFTFPLFGPPFARALHLTGAQTNALASASILGEYAAAVLWGAVADSYGPGTVSFAASALYLTGYGLLGWQFRVAAQAQRDGVPLHPGLWIWLCVYYLLAGSAVAGSYFGAIIAATKSTPSRHAGLAIGIPCAIFGLSPLFFSALAPYFTIESGSFAGDETSSGINDELDPGKWLMFLAVMLAVVNALSGLGLADLSPAALAKRGMTDAATSSGIADVDDGDESDHDTDDGVDERTGLIQQSSSSNAMSSSLLSLQPQPRQSIMSLLATPTFWIFGSIIFLTTGPGEMVFASVGGIVESMLGVHIALSPLGAVLASAEVPRDPRALALRRLHVQVLAISNTLSRLVIGFISDWLSTHPVPAAPAEDGKPQPRSRRPKISRLIFVLVACVILCAAFAFAAVGMKEPAQLWVLSIAVGVSYGVVFTLAPAIVRAVYHVENFGRNWGLLTWASALGALLFTPLFGVMLDHEAQRQGNHGGACRGKACYEGVMALSSGAAAVAACLVVVLWRGWWRGKV